MVQQLKKADPQRNGVLFSAPTLWLITASSGLHGHLDGCMCEYLRANKQNYIIYLCVGE